MSAKKIIKISAITAASLLAAAVISVTGLYIWLTPSRLSSLIAKESEKYLNAEINADVSGYSLLSTFPWFYLQADSLDITSHVSGSGLSDSSLFSSGPISFSINIIDIIKGDLTLNSISVSRPRVNIVVVNDSIANYSIIRNKQKDIGIPVIHIGKVRITAPATVCFKDLRNNTDATVLISSARIKPAFEKTINAAINVDGSFSGKSGIYSIENALPFSIKGNICAVPSPLLFSIGNMDMNVAGISSSISMEYDRSTDNPLQRLDAGIYIPDLNATILALPSALIEKLPCHKVLLSSLKGETNLESRLYLRSPYNPESKKLPDLTARISLKESDLALQIPSRRSLDISNLNFLADIDIDPRNPDSSNIKISKCTFSSQEFKKASVVAAISGLLTEMPSIAADIDLTADLRKLPSLVYPDSHTKMNGSVKNITHIDATIARGTSISLRDIKADGTITSPSVSICEGNSSTALSGLKMGYTLTGKQGPSDISGSVQLSADNLKTGNNRTGLSADGLKALFDIKTRNNPFSNSFSSIPGYSSSGDSLVAANVPHSPLFLSPPLPSILQTILTMTDFSSSVKARSGQLVTSGFPLKNTFRNLDLYAASDSVVVRNAEITSGNSSGRISGTISGLRPFILSPSATPVNIDLTGSFRNIDINDLCLAYYKGEETLTGTPADFSVPPMGPPVKADSLCIAIPRNINARIRLASSEAEYMGFTFSPLSTEISMKDGVARIGDLSIGSQFAKAKLDWIYSTSDLDSIHMDLRLDIDNFDIPRFMLAFPSLHTKVPALDEISGSLSLNAEGSFLMFPDMEINPPSMTAVADLKSDSIMISRNDDKIRHYTHLMLIRGDSPIAVENLDIHSSFHDNFLQVDPFFIKAAGYELQVAGVNNLQSEIYYHLGLFRNPLHMPFGVNIVGDFHHPEIRFGGKSVNDGREREISADINDDVEVNIMQWLKHGWMQFVAAAAKYASLNNQTAYSDVH